ncbi:MAG: hypothetical protein R3D78_13490 [Paracoccaceae bacterium]|jgi:hypothetical protein
MPVRTATSLIARRLSFRAGRPAPLLTLLAASEGLVAPAQGPRPAARGRADLALADFPFFADLLQEA